jgi:hypothetical protein
MKSKFYLGLLGILSLLSKMRSKETDFLDNIGAKNTYLSLPNFIHFNSSVKSTSHTIMKP